MTIRVETVGHPSAQWDAFAEAHPHARLGHAAAWPAVFSTAYGLEPHCVEARDEYGGIRGILPLVAFRPLRGPVQLISLPYLDAAGPLAVDAPTASRLVEHALDLARSQGLVGIELRTTRSAACDDDRSSAAAMDRVNLVLGLEADADAQWGALRGKVRNQVRKAEREGLELATDDGSDLLDGFYGPYGVNMRDLGSPAHPRGFFRAAVQEFGDRLRCIVTRDRERSIGGLIAIRFGRRVAIPWASTLRSERARCPNNQIYWEAMRWAVESGAAELDFGRSPRDAGTYRFKRGWGAREEELSWRRLGVDGSDVPVFAGVASPMLQRISRLWTRLPAPVATRIGGRLRRFLAN